jgi:hypothetical protein
MRIDPITRQGDIVVGRDGIQSANFLQSALPCCLFGGNVEADSQESFERGEQNGAYWGNAFLDVPFNSQTERTINNTVLPDMSEIRTATISDISKLVQTGHASELVDVYIENTGERKVKISAYLRTLNGLVKEVV